MEKRQRNMENTRIHDKLKQARNFLSEAEALLSEGAELSFVINSLYYAMLYPVLALLGAWKITTYSQSTSISTFDREFIEPGLFDKRFSEALHRAFELRPACACEGQKVITREDIERLLTQARDFSDAVEKCLKDISSD
ncbi:MAG: hypothetical protein A2Z46_06840 [Nitrospirae bacterium RBG_19FT_COMBO_55_12]|nr:MAG: hypothetical protein A2Z46_06840 [Nitrospirae bacterium RBG_19FT_COMBO_55_12]